jgi:acetoin utilization deacetylase AcuC-like enzyme
MPFQNDQPLLRHRSYAPDGERLVTDQEPRVGFVFDDRYLQHNPGLETHWMSGKSYPFVEPILHSSNFRLVFRSKHLIDLTGLGKDLIKIEGRSATDEQIGWYHTPAYIQKVKDVSAAGGGEAGGGTPIAADGYDIACLSTGGCLAAVDAVATGKVDRSFANVRPPGHHAGADSGMGYCVWNNVVIAARYAQKQYGYKKVMILDWDVHPGNGTQDAFYDDPDILFINLFQHGIFGPGVCERDQIGGGSAAGTNINIAVPPGSGHATYLAAFKRLVEPIAAEFKPDIILVSAGQDASISDPLGRNQLVCESYRLMTESLIQLAAESCAGRLVVLQEGGYSESYAPYCTLAIVETLMERRTGIDEPLSWEYVQRRPETTNMGLDAEAALAELEELLSPHWSGIRQSVAAGD